MTNSSPSKRSAKPPIPDIYPKEVIYCEDDYFAEFSSEYYHLRCDRSIQSSTQSPLPFDYDRFSEYLRVKSHIEFVNRAVEYSKDFISPGIECYADDELKKELFEIYGEMDESSERFVLIFENYKEQRLEQLENWIHMEKEQVMLESEFLDEAQELLKYFSPEELENFMSVSSNKSSEPFLLPRKKLSNDKDNLKIDTLTSKVQDILFSNPLGMTRDILIKKCNNPDKKKTGSHNKVSSGENPTRKLTSQIIEHELTKDILFTRPYFREGYLVFPASLQPILLPDPMTILWNLKHKLVSIVNLFHGIIELDEGISLCFKVFQISRFHYQNWGFGTGLDFVKWLLDKWKSDNVEVLELTLGKDKPSHYIAVMTPERRKLVLKQLASSVLPATFKPQNTHVKSIPAKLKPAPGAPANKISTASVSLNTSITSNNTCSPTTSKAATPTVQSPWSKQTSSNPPLLNYDPTAIAINPKYVQLSQTIVQEQRDITPGTTTTCVVALVNSPTNFYLVRQVRWRELERLFRELRDLWRSTPLELSPHPRFLLKNYLCMAKPVSEEDDVYRVVILAKVDMDHYQVLCIDYGDIFKVRHDQLRFLPLDYLYNLDAQAITCSLYNVASSTKDPRGNDVWKQDIVQLARKLFNPDEKDLPTVKVLFKQRMQTSGKWLVKVSSPKCEDFGVEIMEFVNKTKAKS